MLHSDLFQSYVQWCQRNEIEHDNPMTLGKRLNKRVYVSKKFGKYHTTKYINIKLKNSPNYDRIDLELPL